VASAQHSAEYFLPISRLAEIENHAALPTIYRIYALCTIYHLSFQHTLLWYGVDLSQLSMPPGEALAAPVPTQTRLLDPGNDHWVWDQIGTPFGESKTKSIGPVVPSQVCYAQIGSEDRAMDPLIPPGSLVRIDTSLRRVLEWAWRNEFERPIYFVEHTDGYSCSWCSVHHKTLVLEPHPLSACSPKMYRIPQQAEVRGQVIGVTMAMRSLNGPSPLPAGDPARSAGR
jgi:hypothetical protein